MWGGERGGEEGSSMAGAAVNFTHTENWKEEAVDSRGAVNGDPTGRVEGTGRNPRKPPRMRVGEGGGEEGSSMGGLMGEVRGRSGKRTGGGRYGGCMRESNQVRELF